MKSKCHACGTETPETLLVAGYCNDCRLDQQEAKEAMLAEHELSQDEFNAASEARREVARRELCRRRYLPFVQRFTPDYMAGWVHVEICEKLEQFMRDVEAKKSPRLMIFMPPRHGKSQLTSKTFPAWVLGQHPTWEFMCCSYSGSLAQKFSRSTRSIMRDPKYHSLFETRLSPDTQGQEQWETTEGGGLLAAGVGGPITGQGAHILMIDDPVKNREEAESALIREGSWDWYTSTAYTRLAPGGGILVIQTRWHDDDMSGRLIKEMENGGDQWEIIEYPAIALKDEKHRKEGEALHPERYDETALARIRRVSERDWWALYQQQPVADEGAYFTRDMFKFYKEHELPPRDELVFYDAWDLAVGKQDHNDYSVGMTAGYDREGNLWFVDRLRGRLDAMLLVESIIDLHLEWGSQITGLERGQIDLAIGPFLEKRIAERQAWTLYTAPLKTGRRDKEARARAIQGMCRQGKVWLPHPEDKPWVLEFINECLRFPAGVHDDQVDAFAWIGQMIMEMAPSVPLPAPKKASWRDRLDKYITDDSRHKSFMSA